MDEAANKIKNKKDEEEKEFLNMIVDETVDTPIRPREMQKMTGNVPENLKGLGHLHHNQGSHGP